MAWQQSAHLVLRQLGPEGAPFAEAVVTTGPVTGFWISKHDFGQLRCRDKLLTAMAKVALALADFGPINTGTNVSESCR